MFARTEHKHRTPSDIQLKDDDSHQLVSESIFNSQAKMFSLGLKCDICSDDLWGREGDGQLRGGDLRRRHP